MRFDNDINNIRKFFYDIKDFSLYIKAITEIKKTETGNILMLVSVRDTIGYYFTEQLNALWKNLGFNSNLSGKHWHGYAALTNFKDLFFEELSEENKSIRFKMDADPSTHVRIFSSPWTDRNTSYIRINGEEYSDNFRGFNIVLYDMISHTMIDTASFDTHTPEIQRLRRDAIHPVADIIGRLKIRNIFPQDDIKDILITDTDKQNFLSYSEKMTGKKKIEVRIVFFGFAGIWNTLRSLALEFAKDEKYHVVIIVCYDTDGQALKLQVISDDLLEFIDVRDYDINLDKVDIWLTNAWNERVFDDLNFADDKNRKLFITVNPTLINGGMPISEFFYQLRLLSSISDYLIISEVIHNNLTENGEKIDNAIPMALPQFDSFYEMLNPDSDSRYGNVTDQRSKNRNRTKTAQHEKLEGKKVILWVTDHVWDTKNVTFDLYIKDVIQYFKEHEDIGLIIRPHNMYIREMLYAGIWSPSDLETIRKYFNKSPNMIWDETPDIALAYSMADAVICDVNCGLSISALILDKPLAVIYRNDGNECIPINKEITDNLYELNDWNDMKGFFEMVAAGREEDGKKSARQYLFEKYIGNFDGNNGARIKKFIEEEYYKKVNN